MFFSMQDGLHEHQQSEKATSSTINSQSIIRPVHVRAAFTTTARDVCNPCRTRLSLYPEAGRAVSEKYPYKMYFRPFTM